MNRTNIRKTIRHYGKLGGRHRDSIKSGEPLDPTSELEIRTCPQCHNSQYEHEGCLGDLGHVKHYRCRSCGGTFLHREGSNQ